MRRHDAQERAPQAEHQPGEDHHEVEGEGTEEAQGGQSILTNVTATGRRPKRTTRYLVYS